MAESEEENFDALFAEDSGQQEVINQGKWNILVVDDEKDIHSVIRLALDGFSFQNKSINIIDAYSGKEAREILSKTEDIAVVLLDVVMETDNAGLNFVKFIREEIKNPFVRVILWTGQPGHAPKKEVVVSYEINDYKTKTDLTDENIFLTVMASIRSYDAMMEIESYRQNLEEKVKERTREIQEQKNKIEEQKNKITDSISYAKRIQDSILPSDKIIKKYFPNSFIFFRPRDIVSGDFYWFAEPMANSANTSESPVFIAAADCTGHGVPGALMSMIGSTMLNEIVNNKKIFSPSEILSELNDGIIKALNQTANESDDVPSDGMDITLCKIDTSSKKIYISCASHVVFVVNNEEIKMIEGDIHSIGGMFSVIYHPEYSVHEVDIQDDTAIYMFSDGFQDQFGGENNQKFMLTRFQELLFSLRKYDMQTQLEKLKETFETWQGTNRQIDDILVMGIKLNN